MARTTFIPGENTEAPEPELTPAQLKAKLAAAEAENAELKAKNKLPQVVYEPDTPHGKIAMAESPTAGISVADVRSAIQERRLKPPVTSYLCSDGYYSRNVDDEPKG